MLLDEDRATVLELLRAAGEVCDHPMLRAIVNEAPSPSAADKHIMDLGWGCDLARQVRMAVRAKQKVQSVSASKLEWEELFATTARPADAMFRFEYFNPKEIDLNFPPPDHQRSAAVRFGGMEAPCDNWPFFLREFWLRDDENYATTVDFRGSERLFSCHATSRLDPKLWASCSGSVPLHYYSGGPGQRDFAIRKEDRVGAFFQYWLPQGHILSQIKRMDVLGEPFPRFYKAVEVQKETKEGNGLEYERIRVLFRLDIQPTNPPKVPDGKGEVWYERIVPVSDVALAILRLRYHITHRLELRFDRPEGEDTHLQYLGVECVKDYHKPGIWGHLEHTSELLTAMSALHADLTSMLRRAYASRPQISLERVAGFSLVTNPPERLADLF